MKAILPKIIFWGRTAVRGFLDGHCSLHAAGLTYFSMLALIPILCCVLVVAKVAHVDAFARSQIDAQINAFLVRVERGADDPTAPSAKGDEREDRKRIAATEFAHQARRISDGLFARIDRFDIGRLGWIGLATLLWTVISMLGQVEVSVNEVWGVKKARPIWKRAYLYLFIAIVMPVLAVLAMSLPILGAVKDVIVATMGATYLTKWASDGLVWFIDYWLFRLLISYGFASCAFGYLLWVLPNCRVRVRDAVQGGALTAGLFWAVMKVCAVAQVGIAKASALYGSFAFLPIVLAWLYLSWQVVLLGASMTRAFATLRIEQKETLDK